MDTLTAIANRRSTRSFDGRPVERELLEKVVDAGRLAPTARNDQPWEFVVVTEGPARKRIAELAPNGSFIAQAPACVAVFCKDSKYYLEDGCNASTAMLVAATALGLQSCWVAGDKKPYGPAIGVLLGRPDGYRLVSLIALGHGNDPEPRVQKRPLSEVLHWERW